MEQQLYKKVGRRYRAVGYSDGFTGFPTEGIWAVYSKPGTKTQSCIARVGEFQNIDYSKLASIYKDKHYDICKIISQRGKTISEIANEIMIELIKETK